MNLVYLSPATSCRIPEESRRQDVSCIIAHLMKNVVCLSLAILICQKIRKDEVSVLIPILDRQRAINVVRLSATCSYLFEESESRNVNNVFAS